MTTSNLNCCELPTRHDTADVPAEATANCCTPQRQSTSEALRQIQSTTATTDLARVRAAGFRLLLDTGKPVGLAELADAADLDLATVERLVKQAKGRVQVDDAGRLLGVAGLTVSPTQHEITIGDQKRWTWCALDAVGILGALNATGTIRSTDPQTGRRVHIEVVNGQPEDDATLFILGGYEGGNVTEDWCPLVNFFTTHSDAQEWVTANNVTGDIVSVSEIAADATSMWRPVTDPA